MLALVSEEMAWPAQHFAFLGTIEELGLMLSLVASCVSSESPGCGSARSEDFAECAMFAQADRSRKQLGCDSVGVGKG